MADLTTLDRTQPPDTQDRSQGAQRIRETRDAILSSFAVEHALDGAHKFIYGAPGSKPAAGHPGRIFIDTTNGYVELDNGAAWVTLHAVAGFIGGPGATVTLTTSYQNLLPTVSITTSLGQSVLLLGYVTISNPLIVPEQDFFTKFLVDGGDVFPGEQIGSTTVSNAAAITIGMTLSRPAGAHTINYVGRRGGGGALAVGSSLIGVSF